MSDRVPERVITNADEAVAAFKAFVEKQREFQRFEGEAKLAYVRLAKEKMPGANAYYKLAVVKALICDRFHVPPDKQPQHLWTERLVWLQAVIEAREARKPKADEPAPDVPKGEKETRALALLCKHPEWSDSEIAKRVPCNRTSLYRMKKYQEMRAVLKQTNPRGQAPRGEVQGGPPRSVEQ